MEQILVSETSPVLLYRLTNLIRFYEGTISSVLKCTLSFFLSFLDLVSVAECSGSGGKKNWLQLQIKVCKHTFKNYLRFEITLTFFLFQDLFYSIYTNLDETEKNLLESGSFYPASAKITGSATLRPVNIKLFQLCLICIGEAKARIGWY